jgi:hypothetical protein
MNYSRRQLEAFGEPFGEGATRKKPGGRIYGTGGGGGGGGPTTTTVNQSNIPEYLRPQVEGIIGGASQELFNYTTDENGNYTLKGPKAFVPYSANVQDYVAGFSPLQQQVQANAANLQMPGQYNQATDYANQAAQGGFDSAGRAYGYGNAGFQSGQQGQQLGIAGGQYYGNMGAQAGMQGQQSGLLGQQLGIEGGQRFGEMGAGYGKQGTQLGLQGGQLGIQGGQKYGSQGAGYGAQGAGYGAQAVGLAPQAQRYGQKAADIGQMGLRAEQLGRNITGQSRDYAAQQAAAGQQYANQMTNPYAVQQYMSPYQQNVTDIQNQAAQRNADIAATGRQANAARAGAFGGSRQAIENAEANRALQTTMNANQAQGQQAAYDKAIQNMQYGSNLGLQGLSGAQSGLGTALQGGQLGLSGIGTAMTGQQAGLQGLQAANQFYGTGIQGSQAGMQGAGVGLQGINTQLSGVDRQLAGTAQGMQGAQIGLQGVDRQLAGTAQGIQGAQSAMQGAGVGLSGVNAQLAGTAQGMQGSQMGLQGVSGAQAGYGLADRAAGTLGTLGNQQLAAQTGILGLQNQIGGQQQSQQQQYINQAIQNFAQAQENPMQRYNQINAMVRGYALPGTTTTQYQASPSLLSQVGGAGIAGVGLYNAMNPGTR